VFFSFLSSIRLVSYTLPFHPFCFETLPLYFPLSLSPYSSCTLSSLCNLAFLCPFLASLSNIFLALSLPRLVSSILPFPVRLILFALPLSLIEHHHFRLLNIHFHFFLSHVFSQVLHHFFHLSFTLCHNYQVVLTHQALNFLSTPAYAFFNISSISATYIVNSRGQPCLTPFIVSNHSPSFSITLHFVFFFLRISSQSSVPSAYSSSLSYTQTFSLRLPRHTALNVTRNVVGSYKPFFQSWVLLKKVVDDHSLCPKLSSTR
jgi:hypothetical protein